LIKHLIVASVSLIISWNSSDLISDATKCPYLLQLLKGGHG